MNARRAKVKKYNTDPEYKKKIDEDKRARALAERPPDPIVNAFNIIIPLAPFGIPGGCSDALAVPIRPGCWLPVTL